LIDTSAIRAKKINKGITTRRNTSLLVEKMFRKSSCIFEVCFL